MKKWICLIVVLNLFCSAALSQDTNGVLKQTDISQYCRLDTLLSFKNESGGTAKHPVMASFGNRYVFTCYDARSGCDTVVLYSVNTDTYNVDTIRIYEQGISHYIQKNLSDLKAVSMWDSLIVLFTYKRAFVYRLKEDGSCQKIKAIKIPSYFKKVQMVNDHTILFVGAYHSLRKHRTTLCLYDIEKGKVVNTIHPYLNSTLNTYLANMSSADYRNGSIIWTHNNEYSFVDYNLALQQTDSIHYDGIPWHPLPDYIVHKALQYHWTEAVEIMNTTVLNRNLKVDMIMWVLWLDDDRLMIVRKPHDTNIKSIDLWSKKTGEWQPTLCNITDAGYWLNMQDTVRNHIQLGFSAGDYVSSCGGKIVALTPMGSTESFDNLTGKEYALKRDEYLLDNDYFLQLRIYTYDFGDIKK